MLRLYVWSQYNRVALHMLFKLLCTTHCLLHSVYCSVGKTVTKESVVNFYRTVRNVVGTQRAVVTHGLRNILICYVWLSGYEIDANFKFTVTFLLFFFFIFQIEAIKSNISRLSNLAQSIDKVLWSLPFKRPVDGWVSTALSSQSSRDALHTVDDQ